MDKTLYSASLLFALLLIIGSFVMPNNAVMWLAATSWWMNGVRLIIIAMMVGLIVTHPPRSLRFRMLLGVVALILAAGAMAPLMRGSVHVLDMLLAAESSIAFLLAAIEAAPLPAPAEELQPYWMAYLPQAIMVPLAVRYATLETIIAKRFEESAVVPGWTRPHHGHRWAVMPVAGPPP